MTTDNYESNNIYLISNKLIFIKNTMNFRYLFMYNINIILCYL